MAILVQDSFNRADNTTSLGVTDTGQTWENIIAGFGILGNQAYTATQGDRVAVVNSGVSDGKVQITHAVYHQYSKVFWRFTDVSNCYWIEANLIRKKVGVTTTTIATLSQTIATGDTLRIELNGSSHTIYKNGVQVGAFTDSFNQAATKHGIGIYATAARLDNFLVESLTETPTGTPGTTLFSTKQVVSKQGSSIQDTKQVISSMSQMIYSMKQAVFNPANTALSTKQTIYRSGQSLFDSLQEIIVEQTVQTVQFSTRIEINHVGSSEFPTMQQVYESNTLPFDLLQMIYETDGIWRDSNTPTVSFWNEFTQERINAWRDS